MAAVVPGVEDDAVKKKLYDLVSRSLIVAIKFNSSQVDEVDEMLTLELLEEVQDAYKELEKQRVVDKVE